MNNTQKINLSPVLAQKKLLSGGNSNNGSSSLAAPSFNSGTKDTHKHGSVLAISIIIRKIVNNYINQPVRQPI